MVTEVDLQDLEQAPEDGALLFDVRESDEYAEGHVPGAQLLSSAGVEARSVTGGTAAWISSGRPSQTGIARS